MTSIQKKINKNGEIKYLLFKPDSNGKSMYWGSYKSMKDAEEAIEYFNRNGWNKKQRKIKRYNTTYKYITQIKDKYRVQKKINGKLTFFGQYTTLKEAIRRRNECIIKNWNTRELKAKPYKNIAKTQYGTYMVHKKINKKRQYFGVFKTLKEAQKHREYCIENKWNDKCKKYTHKQEDKYIHHFKNFKKYYVIRQKDGKRYNYGGFDNVEDARRHRDYCIANNWKSHCKIEN